MAALRAKSRAASTGAKPGAAMTIVVFRDGIMAADSLATNHHNVRVRKIRKLARRDSDGALAGVAGFAGDCTDFLAWFLRNKEGES